MASTSTSRSGPKVEIEKLRSLFLMLDPSGSSLSEADKIKRQEVWTTFDLFVQCSRRIKDYYQIPYLLYGKRNYNNIVPRFMQLLRENVLCHQWPEALKLVKTMCYEVQGTDSAIWKVGLACLYQDRERNGRLVEQFVKQVQALRKLAVVEVFLDYLLFLLGQSNIEDAKLLVQQLKQNTLYASNLNNERRTTAQTLFFAYQGLALYAEWKLAIFKADREEDEMEMVSQLLSHGSDAQITKSIAETAADYLVTLVDIPGVWDIFISRLIEIYDYYGKTQECRNILISYRDRNPNNPNAHHYLFKFECSHDGEETVQLQCLQNIIKLDPCNPLCLNLYNLKVQNDPTAVSLLFDFLDYSHCSGNEEVWEVLANTLHNIERREPMRETLMECWKSRRDWWPEVIFKRLAPLDDPTEQSEPTTLMRNKQCVYKVLLQLDKSPKKTRDDSGSEIDLQPTAKRRKIRQQSRRDMP